MESYTRVLGGIGAATGVYRQCADDRLEVRLVGYGLDKLVG